MWYNFIGISAQGGGGMGLRGLPNVGKVLEKNLMDVGITTPEALQEEGACSAFLKIRAAVDPGACLHMLYGLEGAVRGIPDAMLDAETRNALRDFFASL